MNKFGLGKPDLVMLCSALGLAAVTLLCFGWLNETGSGDLKMTTVVPAKGQPYSVAISADGTKVAMMHQEFSAPSGGVTRDMIEVRDVQSGREVGSFSLPTINWANRAQYYVSRNLMYCDGGKYLLAFSGPDTIYVTDARSFQLHALIALNMLPRSLVEVDCSVNANIAALAAWGDMGLSIKLLDLDKGAEIADLGGILDTRSESYTGDGMAISPDGSKLALGISSGEGSVVKLVDTRTKGFLGRLALWDESWKEHRLAFAGDGALVIGERRCDDRSEKCELRSAPRGRTLRVWDFGGNGTVRTLGWPGAEAYGSIGASADGNVVFGYTGTGSYCNSCNEGGGELKIDDARFTVWDRGSGRVVARSPSLKVEVHRCFLQIIGSCTAYEREPELQMSADGKAVLAFWPPPSGPPPDKAGELEVYRRH